MSELLKGATNITKVVYDEALKAYKEKNYDKAGKLFEELFSRDTQSAVISYFGGVCAYRRKRWDIAEKMFIKSANQKKNFYYSMYGNIFLALLYVRKRRIDEAKKCLENVFERDFKNPVVFSLMGYIANKEKKYEEAEKYYQKSIKLDRNNASFHNNLGFNYLEWEKKLDKAEYHIELAVKKNVNNPFYLHSMGWLFFVKKNYRKSINFLKQSFRIAKYKRTEQDIQKAEVFSKSEQKVSSLEEGGLSRAGKASPSDDKGSVGNEKNIAKKKRKTRSKTKKSI